MAFMIIELDADIAKVLFSRERLLWDNAVGDLVQYNVGRGDLVLMWSLVQVR